MLGKELGGVMVIQIQIGKAGGAKIRMKARVIEVLVMEEAVLIGAMVEMDRAHPARGPLS